MSSARPLKAAWLGAWVCIGTVNPENSDSRSEARRASLVLVLVILLSACTSSASDSDQLTITADDESVNDSDQPAGPDAAGPDDAGSEVTATDAAGSDVAGGEVTGSEATAGEVTGSDATAGSGVDLDVLPMRSGSPEETTGSVPHIQTSATRDPELALELARRAYELPGVENRESVTSLPGAQSLWYSDEIELARPEVLMAGREFGHIHPDSSMHLWLPVDRALEVAENGWGERHPWTDRDGFWEGVVMVWAPESDEDVAVSFQLIVDAFNFVAGQDLDALDFP